MSGIYSPSYASKCRFLGFQINKDSIYLICDLETITTTLKIKQLISAEYS